MRPRHLTPLLCAAAVLFTIPLFCAFAPTQITLDFGPGQAILGEAQLQGGWYNYEAKLALTKGRNLFARALQMGENDTFAGTFPDIIQYIDRLAPQYEVAAYDGQVNFHPDQTPLFTVTNQRAGKIIDRERLYGDILAVLKGNKFPTVKVHYQTVAPTPAEQIIAGITKRSHFSTHFNDNPPREKNLRLALSKFHGLVVHPGETVSFNQIVGARTAAQGYEAAKIIVGGEYVDGIGGGVCQVSTTIFNAVAQAGLHILEAHNHSLPSSYVPLGKDAMVSSGVDLRFANNTGAPVYFATKVQNNHLHVTIYGRDKGQNITYQLATQTIKDTPPKDAWEKDLPEKTIKDYQKHPKKYDRVLLSAGRDGHTVDTYLETYQGDKRLSRKLLRRATYQPTPNKYTLRLKDAPPPTDPDSAPSQ